MYKMTRAEWVAEKKARDLRTGTHGFDPEMPWTAANWKERVGIILFHLVMWCVAAPAFVVGGVIIIGMMIDSADRYHTDHDRCLRSATNGYEIKQCH